MARLKVHNYTRCKSKKIIIASKLAKHHTLTPLFYTYRKTEQLPHESHQHHFHHALKSIVQVPLRQTL